MDSLKMVVESTEMFGTYNAYQIHFPELKIQILRF